MTLLSVRQTGRPKSVFVDNNIEKIKRSLEERPWRSVRDLSKQTKLSSSLKEEKLAEKLLVSAKWSASLLLDKEAMEWLSEILGSRLRNADFLRPSYPLDLNPYDFYLWGYLKSRVYNNPVPHNTEQLKENIRREVRRIKQTTVVSAVENLLARIQNLVFQEGPWFEQIVNY